MRQSSTPPESLQPITYLHCSGCKRQIDYTGTRVEIAVKERGRALTGATLCLYCYFEGYRILPSRSQAVAAVRCQEMRRMRKRGELLKNIGHTFGLDHSTVIHHLQGRCKCQA